MYTKSSMSTLLQVSALVLSAGWLISGVLFTFQYLKIFRTNDTEGISPLTFFGFSILNANATIYGYLTSNFLWIPGTILASLSCALIAWSAFHNHAKR